MSKDLIGSLGDDWWSSARGATKWKPKYQCMRQIFEILTGSEGTAVEIKCSISDHKDAGEFLKILVDWMVNENHVFVRIAIFRLMPKLIESLPTKKVAKCVPAMLETILTKQWMEKKKKLLDLVTPTLLRLWLKTKFKLDSDDFRPHFFSALQHRGKEARFSAADFLAKVTMNHHLHRAKKAITTLCSDREFAPLLTKLAKDDKERVVRIAGCRVFVGLHKMGIFDAKKEQKTLPVTLELKQAFSMLAEDKRSRKNLEAARAEYEAEAHPKPIGFGADSADKKKKKRRGSFFRMNRFKKDRGALSALCWPAARSRDIGGDGNDDEKMMEEVPTLRDDEKEENGKRYKKVVTRITRTRPKTGCEFETGSGGKLNRGFVRCAGSKVDAVRPRMAVHHHQFIDSKSLENNRKALGHGAKFQAISFSKAMKTFAGFVDDDEAQSLRKETKVRHRVHAVESVAAEIERAAKWDQHYDAIIALAAESMGWEGADSRNPTLSKLFLRLISEAMARGKVHKKNSGLFTVYLSWAMQRLQEQNKNKLATECLMATLYQFSPKVVLSAMERLLFEPDDEQNDPFKNDKSWGPVLKFMGDAVQQFGVHNVFVCRLINAVHRKLVGARGQRAKNCCYHTLKVLHQQLGDDWKDVLMAPLSKSVRKTADKQFAKNKNPGTYTQWRCTKKEAVPKPMGGEMEEFTEEIVEWVEVDVVADAASQRVAAPQCDAENELIVAALRRIQQLHAEELENVQRIHDFQSERQKAQIRALTDSVERQSQRVRAIQEEYDALRRGRCEEIAERVPAGNRPKAASPHSPAMAVSDDGIMAKHSFLLQSALENANERRKWWAQSMKAENKGILIAVWREAMVRRESGEMTQDEVEEAVMRTVEMMVAH